ncbi:hypothetical protein [Candidatus Accumulibacter sp. ACC012]|jgi:hypothetical protein|uniref:hypothetical protein n=1 Tax=Candidatus Accumulibacter sp. ACC012 TaxID=2823332 RepID=UPI0025C04864|nr:hypothetical protein [Candidatus Accumulibacter sp. ACC012]
MKTPVVDLSAMVRTGSGGQFPEPLLLRGECDADRWPDLDQSSAFAAPTIQPDQTFDPAKRVTAHAQTRDRGKRAGHPSAPSSSSA